METSTKKVEEKVAIIYKNVIIIIPKDVDPMMLLSSLRYTAGNLIAFDKTKDYIFSLKDIVPASNFYFNIPYSNKYINSDYCVFEHNDEYSGLGKVAIIKYDVKQYEEKSLIKETIGTFQISDFYNIAKHDIYIPPVFSDIEMHNYYSKLEFINTTYGDIPILEKKDAILKEAKGDDRITRRLSVSPEYPNIIVNYIKKEKGYSFNIDNADAILNKYNYVFKYSIFSRTIPDVTLSGYILFRDTICAKDMVHLDLTGFGSNLFNVDILYLLATIIIPDRSVDKKYLTINAEKTMSWTADETEIYVPKPLTNPSFTEYIKDDEKGFWTKNRNIF